MANLKSIIAPVCCLSALLLGCSENSTPTTSTSGTPTDSAAAEPPSKVSNAIGEVVQTWLGEIRGETVTEVGATALIFKGIPYAAPPVGNLRWKAPQPPKAWDGIRDGTVWPNRCPQGESSMGTGGPISEDCLYLNVVTTAKTTEDAHPVMVFFHGGGLTSGTGNSTTYNHPKLPSKGVVVVTVNSRLGPMGYLSHPALTAEDPNGSSGNYGTLDLKASLEWVQQNIHMFGGDPKNVTIFGQSGGGAKITSQMATPLTEALFHRAIVQSGSALVSPDRITTLEAAEARGKKLAAVLGIEDGANVLAEMRAKPWQEIIEAGANEEVGFRAGVVVDGYVIPEPIPDIFAKGKQQKVPLMIGATAGERSLQSSVPLMADLHSATGTPTFTYNFTHLPKQWREEEGCVAFHGLELTYVFGAVPIGLSSPTTQFLARSGGCSAQVPEHDEQDMQVADQLATVWAQFAKTGNPSTDGLIEWPAYTKEANNYADLGMPLTAKTGIQESYTPPPASAGSRF